MIINYIHRIGWFVGLILLQVLILNNVHIAGVATPFLYVYFILKFNSGTSRNELMVWGFCMGLAIDIFSNTPGMNAAATVLLALDSIVPSLKSMGIASFLKYLVVSVFVHHFMLLTLEFFSFTSIPLLLLRVVSSTILTITCIMAVEGVRR